VSDDFGRSWRQAGKTGPEQRSFSYRADCDGTFWFIVRTLDGDGRFFPAVVEGSAPGLKVIVDTQTPQVSLRGLPLRREQVGVEWDVRDDTLDISSLMLEEKPQGGDWTSVPIEPQPSGQKYWTPSGRLPLEVRLRVRDRAGNQGQGLTAITANGSHAIASDPIRDNPPNNPEPPRHTQSNASNNYKVVKSVNVTLPYSLEDVGPSGVSAVELWITTNGSAWSKLADDADKTSPFDAKLPGEGLFGLTMVVRSGVGYGDRAPRPGDPPQLWVEVDLTKPAVQLVSAEAGRGPQSGTLAVTWTAADKNIAARPVSLFYAEQPNGPWLPIVTALENTGRHVWRMPSSAPYQFYVKVEALDRGGNVGEAISAKPIIVDLSNPKGRLLGIDGAPN
jgi:hypothetical protein